MTTATLTERAAALRGSIADLEGRAATLNTALHTADYAQRPPLREELADVDQQLRELRAELPALAQAADAERQQAADRANRLDRARRLLAGVQADVERARIRAAKPSSAGVVDPWLEIVRQVERARAQLRAAGENVAERITIEL